MNKQIIDSRNNYVPFGTLQIGDCFTYNKDLCIKTPNLYDDYNKRHNAVSIDSGSARHFYDEDNVIGITNLKIEIL